MSTTENNAGTEIATLGGGCFWCVEAVFERLQGVERVESGYTGGHVVDPTYRAVCAGTTGHAEVIQVEFLPHEISYREILEIFFTVHDPTTLNRQGADSGTQYRSAIFTHSDEQRRIAQELLDELDEQSIWPDPIVTEVTELEDYYPGEEYHQEYYRRNTSQPYCQVVIEPKLAKLRAKFADRLRPD